MPAGSPATVLVVEDEMLIRLNAVEMIADAGWNTLEASNSAEALLVLEEHSNVDVLFTDINMPGDMDGLELAQMVHKRRPNIGLVVTSGKRFLPDIILPDQGTFLPKPYTLNELVDVLRTKAQRP